MSKILLSNENFAEELLSLETEYEVQNLLLENGIEFTSNEILAIRDVLLSKTSSELDDDVLENVFGGTSAIGIFEVTSIIDLLTSNDKNSSNSIDSLSKKRW